MTRAVDLEAALETVAEIVGTVDLERALRDLGRPPTDASLARPDPLLGGNVLVFEGDAVPLALAEPTTEGRLAASLARHGEGRLGRYAAVPHGTTLADFRREATARGIPLSGVAHGPFGASVLALDRPATGPHLIVVEPVRYHRPR